MFSVQTSDAEKQRDRLTQQVWPTITDIVTHTPPRHARRRTRNRRRGSRPQETGTSYFCHASTPDTLYIFFRWHFQALDRQNAYLCQRKAIANTIMRSYTRISPCPRSGLSYHSRNLIASFYLQRPYTRKNLITSFLSIHPAHTCANRQTRSALVRLHKYLWRQNNRQSCDPGCVGSADGRPMKTFHSSWQP